MLKEAGYITEERDAWGERTVIRYQLTTLGKDRYDWFRKINSELFEFEQLDE